MVAVGTAEAVVICMDAASMPEGVEAVLVSGNSLLRVHPVPPHWLAVSGNEATWNDHRYIIWLMPSSSSNKP